MSEPGKVEYWRNAYIAADEKAGALGERAHAAEEKVARVEALAEDADCDHGGSPVTYCQHCVITPAALRTALEGGGYDDDQGAGL
jgi:hypothetical protein